VASYRRCIARGCDTAFPPPAPLARQEQESYREWNQRLNAQQRSDLRQWRAEHRWHPHQLRHSAATRFRREYGVDAAGVLLGHSSLAITGVYAEQDQTKAMRIMAKVG
jgi:integrase